MAEKQVREKVKKEYDSVCETELKIKFWDSLLQPACSSTAMTPKMLYLVFAGFMVMQGSLSIGVLISVYDLINYIIGPTVIMPFILNGLNSSIASMERIMKIEDLPQAGLFADSGRKDESDASYKSKTTGPKAIVNSGFPSIKLHNISFSYNKNTPVLCNFTFEHEGCGIVAVCGKSGSGKTTLLDLISGIFTPDSGSIETNGSVSVVSQDTYIFADTIANNIRIAKPDAAEEELLKAARLAGVDLFAESLREGYDTCIGDGNSDMSGGQKQRISLARTILADDPIWLLDEPTSALDTETEKIILDTMKMMSEEKLILVSAHRESLLEIADRRIEIC